MGQQKKQGRRPHSEPVEQKFYCGYAAGDKS